MKQYAGYVLQLRQFNLGIDCGRKILRMPWTAGWMFWHILRWKGLVALAYQEYSFDIVTVIMHLVVYIERALECEDKAYWY